MSREAREVVVVGGGPAGSALACFLAAGGGDVLVLDDAVFPRDKVCGEGVSPEAWRLLERMGAAERVRGLCPQPLRGMRLVSPDGTEFRGEYDGRLGFAARRTTLDHALLDAARARGAEVREGVRVSGLLLEDGRVVGVRARGASGPVEILARLVAGADGRRSVVARQLGLLRESRRFRRFAVRGHWTGVDGLSSFGEMHVTGGGYCGIAPLSGTLANVAFVLDAREMGGAGGDLEAFYRATLARRWPRVAERLAGASLVEPPRAIGPLALESRGVVASGALLVGDAAGFYDPFTGEGITLALRTAELAAEAAEAALASPAARPLPSLEAYARSRRAATRDKFRFNRLLQVAVASPAAANAVARRLARRPDLANRLVGVAGDFVPARTALAPRFLLDLLLA